MKTLSRNWFAAPLLLSGVWALIFMLTMVSQPSQPWWYDFVLHPGSNVLTALTTGLFHVDSVHLLSNVVLLFFVVYSFRPCLSFSVVMLLWWCVAPCAALVSYAIDPAPLIGASGGIFGVFGGAFFCGVHLSSRRTINWSMWALAFSFVALVPGDIVAHLSGSVFGYGGYYVQQKLFFNGTNRHKNPDIQ